MFSKHLILKVNNEEVLYLYLNNYEEISNEFKNNNRQENLINNIKNYIINHNINTINSWFINVRNYLS